MAIDRAKVQKEAEKLLAANKVDRAIEAETRKMALTVSVSELIIPAQPGQEEAAMDLARRLSGRVPLDINELAEIAGFLGVQVTSLLAVEQVAP